MTALDPERLVTATQAADLITEATGHPLQPRTIYCWSRRGHIQPTTTARNWQGRQQQLFRLGDILARRTTSRGRLLQRIWLEDVIEMLDRGDPYDDICRALAVQGDSVTRAALRYGTPEQRARIARARAEQAAIKRAAATTRRKTVPTRRTA